MNVSLTPQLEALVQKKVKSGRYTSASEVIREALRLLEDNDRLREQQVKLLRQDVQAGLDQLDCGEAKELDDVAVRRIKSIGRKRLRMARAKKSA